MIGTAGRPTDVPPRLRRPVDCQGCVAPCCRMLMFAMDGLDRAVLDKRVRATWRAAGAELIPVLPFVYRCSALSTESRCTVYADRPEPCRDYDCRDQQGEDAPRCVLPGRPR